MKAFIILGGLVLAGVGVRVATKVSHKDPVVQQMQYMPYAPAPANTSAFAIQTPGLNPAHGLPGHRCDLAVGAPLPKTAASMQVTSPQNVTINPSPAQSQTPNAASGVKINPSHGLPGHRCDFAVGAPLTGTAPAIQAVPQQNVPQDATNLKINPAHGKPGHRCDIQVGAPLT